MIKLGAFISQEASCWTFSSISLIKEEDKYSNDEVESLERCQHVQDQNEGERSKLVREIPGTLHPSLLHSDDVIFFLFLHRGGCHDILTWDCFISFYFISVRTLNMSYALLKRTFFCSRLDLVYVLYSFVS